MRITAWMISSSLALASIRYGESVGVWLAGSVLSYRLLKLLVRKALAPQKGTLAEAHSLVTKLFHAPFVHICS